MAIRSGTTRPMARSGIAALNRAARRNQRNGATAAAAVIEAAKAAQLNYVRDGGDTRLYRSRRGALVVAWLEGGTGFDDQIELFDEERNAPATVAGARTGKETTMNVKYQDITRTAAGQNRSAAIEDLPARVVAGWLEIDRASTGDFRRYGRMDEPIDSGDELSITIADALASGCAVLTQAGSAIGFELRP